MFEFLGTPRHRTRCSGFADGDGPVIPIRARSGRPAPRVEGDVQGEPAGAVASVVPLPVLDEHLRKSELRRAAAHPGDLRLAGGMHDASLGRDRVRDGGETLPLDPGLSGPVDVENGPEGECQFAGRTGQAGGTKGFRPPLTSNGIEDTLKTSIQTQWRTRFPLEPLTVRGERGLGGVKTTARRSRSRGSHRSSRPQQT